LSAIPDYATFVWWNEPGGGSVRKKSIIKIALAGVLAVATFSPALAAKHKNMTGSCAQPTGRCISDCDQLSWCTMYICSNGQSTPVPLWRCFQPSGLCVAPHC
jgi:hypothetical protein